MGLKYDAEGNHIFPSPVPMARQKMMKVVENEKNFKILKFLQKQQQIQQFLTHFATFVADSISMLHEAY